MEKVSGEVKLMEEMVEFMEKISVRNFEKLTNDDRMVHREMSAVILSSSLAVDVSLIVKDYRSKIEKELNDICTKVSNITIKVDVKDYVDSFQHDDEISAYFEKRKKLNLESEDYRQTLEFMDKLKVIARKEQASEKDLSILIRAYNTIMMVYCALFDTLYSDQSSSVWDIDVSLTINESRSKVQNELNYICNNVTNHTIKESISSHLDAFKAGHLPKKFLPRTFLLQILTDRKRASSQSDMKTTNKKSKLGSGDCEFRSDAEVDFGYHDHSKRIKEDHSKRIKEQEDLYSQINASFKDFYREYVGKGNDVPNVYTVDDSSEHDDDAHVLNDEISAYFEKWNKLTLESEDYRHTLQLMDKLFVIARKEQVSEKDLSILSRAYYTIMMVHRVLSKTLDSNSSCSVRDLDISLTINESRSKVEKELNYICNNMTNHTIKEAISRHLDAFKTGHLPKKLLPRILADRKRVSSQSEIKTTNKKSKLGSGDGFGYHDHTKRIKKQREPLYLQINAIFEDSEPQCVGEGFETQHADDSLEDEYEMGDGIFSF